jgi:NRPS condensation-like uncharacterized protein
MGLSEPSTKRAKTTFPFTVSDKVVYAVDGVSQFMLHFVLEIRGSVDLSLLEQAIQLTLAKSPILKSVARLKWIGSYWEVLDDISAFSILKVMDLTGETTDSSLIHRLLEDYVNEYLDITQRPPVQFLVVQLTPDHWIFVVKVHHCALDPVGIFHLVEDIQDYYGQLVRGEPIPPPPPMEDRGRWLLFKSVPLRLWLRLVWVWMLMMLRHRFEQKRTVRCHVKFSARGPASDRVAYHSLKLARSDYVSLRAHAKSLGVGVNELVIAALCRTVRRWHGGEEQPDGIYSLIMPADVRRYLRKRGQTPRIMSNYVGGTLITVPVEFVTTLQETANYVAEETQFIKDYHDGLRSNLLLPLMSILPPQWLRRKARQVYDRDPGRFVPTAIIAYLGKIDRMLSEFPGCKVVGIEGVGTGFDPVGFDVVVIAYGREYTVTVSYLKDLCTDDEIEPFMDVFSRELLADHVGSSGEMPVATRAARSTGPEERL